MYGARSLAGNRAAVRALSLAARSAPPPAATTASTSRRPSAGGQRAFGSSASSAQGGAEDSAGSSSGVTARAQRNPRPTSEVSDARSTKKDRFKRGLSSKTGTSGKAGSAPRIRPQGYWERNERMQKPRSTYTGSQPRPPVRKTPRTGERYFGIWPQSSLEPLVHDILSSTLASAHLTELAEPVRRSIEVELSRFPGRFATDTDAQPRVVVMHNLDLERAEGDEATARIWRAIWAKFKAMGERPDSPDYRLAFDYLVFDDTAMSLTVKHCDPRADDPVAVNELNFWSLPAGSEARFSLTVLNPPLGGPRDPKRLEYAQGLATVFRHHLLLNPAVVDLAAGSFEQNGFSGTFIRLNEVALLGKFAPKLFDDTIFRKYSCPVPRPASAAPTPRPIAAVNSARESPPHYQKPRILPNAEKLKETKA